MWGVRTVESIMFFFIFFPPSRGGGVLTRLTRGEKSEFFSSSGVSRGPRRRRCYRTVQNRFIDPSVCGRCCETGLRRAHTHTQTRHSIAAIVLAHARTHTRAHTYVHAHIRTYTHAPRSFIRSRARTLGTMDRGARGVTDPVTLPVNTHTNVRRQANSTRNSSHNNVTILYM